MKILVKDDYVIYRKGICECIKEGFPNIVITEAGSNSNLSEAMSATGYDLVIVNFRTREQHQAAAQLSSAMQKFPGVPVIVMDYFEATGITRSNEIGFLPSNCSAEELLTSVTAFLFKRKDNR
ncbi:MAG: response regulator transcription factor [Chitinophagaceae bacterium]|nr:response regulator transcription factor [Chitinophagaceae bacterium]